MKICSLLSYWIMKKSCTKRRRRWKISQFQSVQFTSAVYTVVVQIYESKILTLEFTTCIGQVLGIGDDGFLETFIIVLDNFLLVKIVPKSVKVLTEVTKSATSINNIPDHNSYVKLFAQSTSDKICQINNVENQSVICLWDPFKLFCYYAWTLTATRYVMKYFRQHGWWWWVGLHVGQHSGQLHTGTLHVELSCFFTVGIWVL